MNPNKNERIKIMLSRVTAEFESPELAELAVKRIKESVDYVYSGNIMYDRRSDMAEKLRGGTHYSVLPTAFNTYTNFLTAVLESPTTEDIIPEPQRNRQTTAYIVCGSGAVDNVVSLMNAMGGLNVHSKS